MIASVVIREAGVWLGCYVLVFCPLSESHKWTELSLGRGDGDKEPTNPNFPLCRKEQMGRELKMLLNSFCKRAKAFSQGISCIW